MSAPLDLDALERAVAERTTKGELEITEWCDTACCAVINGALEVKCASGRVDADARAIVAAINASPQLIAIARAATAYADAYSRWDDAERRAACASERQYEKALDAAKEAGADALNARAALFRLAASITTARASGEE